MYLWNGYNPNITANIKNVDDPWFNIETNLKEELAKIENQYTQLINFTTNLPFNLNISNVEQKFKITKLFSNFNELTEKDFNMTYINFMQVNDKFNIFCFSLKKSKQYI